jgi:DNA-binding response OmpR family regulator
MDGQTGTVLVAAAGSTATDIASLLRPDHDVRVADGSEDRRVLDEAIDVAVIDRRTPDPPGDEVLAALRERDVDCRVALVTGADPGDVVETVADDHVTTPASLDEIRSLVDRLLRRADCRERTQQLYALAAERAALAASGDPDGASSPRFEALHEQIERIDDELADVVRSLGPREAFETVIGDG